MLKARWTLGVWATAMAVAVTSASAELSLGQLRTKFEAAIEDRRDDRDAGLEKLRAGYTAALERLKRDLGRQENLAAATQVLREMERVEKGAEELEDLPEDTDYRLKSLREKWERGVSGTQLETHRKIAAIGEAYLGELDERKRSLTRAGRIREALVVEEEANRVRQMPSVSEATQVVSTGRSFVRGKLGDGDLALASKGAKVRGALHGGALIDGIAKNYKAHGAYAYAHIPSKIEVDLGEVYIVDHIRILLYDMDKREYRYSAEVSEDGKAWTMIADHGKTGVAAGWQELRFGPASVRHVRVRGLHNTVNGDFHMVEMEGFSPKN